MRGSLHISQCSVPGWFMNVQCTQDHMAEEDGGADGSPMLSKPTDADGCPPTVPAGGRGDKRHFSTRIHLAINCFVFLSPFESEIVAGYRF